MDFPFERNIDRHNEPTALVIDLVQNLLQPKFTVEIKINDLIVFAFYFLIKSMKKKVRIADER